MTGLAMEKDEKKITRLSEMEIVIKKAKVLFLGLSDDGAYPYVVPVSFGYAPGFFYIHSAKQGQKIRMIQKNSKVAFSLAVDEKFVSKGSPCRSTMMYESICGYGLARFLAQKEEKENGLFCIIRQYLDENHFAFSQKSLENTEVIEIAIEKITGKRSR